MISIASLIAAGLKPTQARVFAEPLARACQHFRIDTPERVAGFLGQCIVESSGFTQIEESLYYSTPERIRAVFPSRVHSLAEAAALARNPRGLANRVYAGRLGNGDEASGDGWRFRGRGLIQLTGRANYSAAAVGCHRPYTTDPDLVALPDDACMTAAWFWASAGLGTLADLRDWDGITRRVNGPAMLHKAERAIASALALEALA